MRSNTPRKIRTERSEAIKCLAEASSNYDAALSEFEKGRLTEAEFVKYDLALATEINNLSRFSKMLDHESLLLEARGLARAGEN